MDGWTVGYEDGTGWGWDWGQREECRIRDGSGRTMDARGVDGLGTRRWLAGARVHGHVGAAEGRQDAERVVRRAGQRGVAVYGAEAEEV